MAVAAAFVWGGDRLPFVDPDEGRYAEIAREMLGSGDWIVPRLYGVTYLEKPPLLYWLVAAAFRLFGLSELAARIVPALSATIGAVATGYGAAAIFGTEVGVLSVTILSTSLLYFTLAHALVTDVPFTSALTIALFAYLLVDARKIGRAPGYAVFWLGLALATLAKGPAALLLAAATIGTHALCFRSSQRLLDGALWALSSLFLLIVVPWFWLVQRAEPDFFSFYLFKEHLARIAGMEHPRPFYWYLPWLLLGFLPWTPRTLVALWRRPDGWPSRHEKPFLAFLLVWVLAVFGLFSLAGGKLVTYILPCFPALAVLSACLLQAETAAGSEPTGWPGTLIETLVYAIVLVAAVGGSVVAPLVLPASAAAVVATAATLSAFIAFAWRRAPFAQSIAASSVAALLVYGAALQTGTAILDRMTASGQIQSLRAAIQPEDEIVLYRSHLPSVAFYTARYPYLVGSGGELEFGTRGRFGGRRLRRLEDLRPIVTEQGKRFYCLLPNRKSLLEAIPRVFPESRVLAVNPGSAYVLLNEPKASEP
jgi:4-amino-4-deoxy-L-arabinose transferase-like glycosyltransferase